LDKPAMSIPNLFHHCAFSSSDPPPPFFLLSWGPLDSLSSSTSSHHGEKRPVVYLSSPISSISSIQYICALFFCLAPARRQRL
jgi:hypothetical protein